MREWAASKGRTYNRDFQRAEHCPEHPPLRRHTRHSAVDSVAHLSELSIRWAGEGEHVSEVDGTQLGSGQVVVRLHSSFRSATLGASLLHCSRAENGFVQLITLCTFSLFSQCSKALTEHDRIKCQRKIRFRSTSNFGPAHPITSTQIKHPQVYQQYPPFLLERQSHPTYSVAVRAVVVDLLHAGHDPKAKVHVAEHQPATILRSILPWRSRRLSECN